MPKIKLAAVDEIPEGGMIARQHGERQILLAKIEGRVYAMDNVCSHSGAELHEGELGEEGPFLVTCPWHSAHFDVRTGKVHQDTDWASDTTVFPVGIEDGNVLVEID